MIISYHIFSALDTKSPPKKLTQLSRIFTDQLWNPTNKHHICLFRLHAVTYLAGQIEIKYRRLRPLLIKLISSIYFLLSVYSADSLADVSINLDARQ